VLLRSIQGKRVLEMGVGGRELTEEEEGLPQRSMCR
jgi:hypothetical protein